VSTTPSETDCPETPGLRARKKAEMRRAISDTATHLFMERGFEAVTVADVAEAAEVSIKTVFNYFGSKEDLFFDREAEVHDGLIAALASRDEGVSLLRALRGRLTGGMIAGDDWSLLDDPEDRRLMRRFFCTWSETPSLRGRWLRGNEGLEDRVAEVVSRDLGPGASPQAVRALAAMIVAVASLSLRAFTEALAADAPREEIERRVREQVDAGIECLAAAAPELA
jgi:AcrR family transcriptional regulator